MAIFYLIRHGKPTYDTVSDYGFSGFGRDFAPLSEQGVHQAEITAKDERLKSAQLIVSSPYTRALQTAQIISKETGLNVHVELGLHEWIPDMTNRYSTSEESFRLAEEFTLHRGQYPDGQTMRWESLDNMRTRMKAVADKYAGYDKVIFVGHGMAFRTLAYIEEMAPAEIVETTYIKGQPDCQYSFY